MKKENASLLGEALSRYLGTSPLGDAVRASRVYAAWDAVMGPVVARATLRRSFSGGTLTLRLNSSVLRMHLNSDAESIAARLNSELGEEIVEKIILR